MCADAARPRDSRGEYARRMHRALAHIDAHLDAPLDLARVAAVAHFSAFHFHRVFAAWMGETLGDYLRRRRVEVAAMRLAAQPRLAVLSVALSVGFGSSEAFARAFRARFGCSATEWRRREAVVREAHGNSGQTHRNPDQARAAAGHDDGDSLLIDMEPMMNVRLIDRSPVTVACLRHHGPYGAPVGRFWAQTVQPWLAANGLLGRPRYGIAHDDSSITAPQQCRYDACVEVPPEAVVGGQAQRSSLPGGRYAVLPFEGTTEQIDAAWHALLRDWLPSSGLQLDARPCFEHYPASARFDPATGVFDCEICVPVAPL